MDIVNFSDEDWNNVEIWVNQKYVVFLPRMTSKTLQTIAFTMMYDADGSPFPADNLRTLVKTIEIYRDGKLWDVPVRLPD